MKSFQQYVLLREDRQDISLQMANQFGDELHMPKSSPWRMAVVDKIKTDLKRQPAREVEVFWCDRLGLAIR